VRQDEGQEGFERLVALLLWGQRPGRIAASRQGQGK
jgi:hypothetical protein